MTTLRLITIFILACLIASGQNRKIKKVETYLRNANYTKACDLSKKIILVDSSTSTILYYYGLCERKNGNYESALGHLNKSIEIDNKNSKSYGELGNVYAMTGNYDMALFNYNRAIELDKSNAYAYNSKGAVYYQFLDDDSLAILNYLNAFALDKKNVIVLYNIGIYYKSKEMYKEAIEYLTDAIKLNKRLHKAYEARAVCYFNLKKYNKAIRGFKKALKFNTTKDPFDKLDDNEIQQWLTKCESANSRKAN